VQSGLHYYPQMDTNAKKHRWSKLYKNEKDARNCLRDSIVYAVKSFLEKWSI